MQDNPYVGPRPYERRHSKQFYGRNREARDLVALILAERVVLFYAQSGAGKTSLLNAKVIPVLEKEDFQVLPTTRVSSAAPTTKIASHVQNVFVYSVLMSLVEDRISPTALCDYTLTTFLQEFYPLEEDAFESPEPLLLIIDQFEELFTAHRERWADAQDFFIQVREALAAVPHWGVLFAMREDYVAELDPYAPLVPRRLRARFRIEPLGPAGAMAAITKPVLNHNIRFAPDVAERMVDDLRRIKVTTRPGVDDEGEGALGPYVEPVQLQVVCRRLWENLPEQDDQTITWDEVEKSGNIDAALTDFYESAVQAAVAQTDSRERELRRWFSEQLLTPMQTRGLALRGDAETAGLPNAAVDVLRHHYIVRAELRAGARWYELVHDRLINPILESNAAWERARLTPLRVAAQEWQANHHPALLYRDATLKEAVVWLKQHPLDAEPYEEEFIAASAQGEHQRKVLRRVRVAVTLVGILIFVMMAFLARDAARSSALAYSKEWAARSQQLRTTEQLASIKAAYEAIAREDDTVLVKWIRPLLGRIDVVDAEIALRQALMDFHPATEQQLGAEITSLIYGAEAHGGHLYAGLSNGEVWRGDGDSGATTSLVALDAVRALAHNTQYSHLAVGGDLNEEGMVRIWREDVQEWGPEFHVPTPAGVYDEVYAVAFSPDGRWLATGGDYGKRFRDIVGTRNAGLVRIWDVRSGEVISLTGHTRRVTSVVLVPISVTCSLVLLMKPCACGNWSRGGLWQPPRGSH